MNMADPYANWKTRFHVLLIHPSEPKLLLTSENNGWALPCIESDVFVWWRNMEEVNQEIRAVMGDQVSGMHCLSKVDNMPERESERIYLFEHRGDAIDWDGRWCSRRDLEDMTFLVPEHQAMAVRSLQEVEGLANPDLRPPWSTPGWFDHTAAWFQEQLDKSGIELIHPIQCIYSWPPSAVLHAETSSGEIYMKAASQLPVFVDEPLLMTFLASLFPNRIPAPICVEPEERWMLLPDLGYPIRQATEGEKVEALLSFGELQRRTVEHTERLLEIIEDCIAKGIRSGSKQE